MRHAIHPNDFFNQSFKKAVSDSAASSASERSEGVGMKQFVYFVWGCLFLCVYSLTLAGIDLWAHKVEDGLGHRKRGIVPGLAHWHLRRVLCSGS